MMRRFEWLLAIGECTHLGGAAPGRSGRAKRKKRFGTHLPYPNKMCTVMGYGADISEYRSQNVR